MITSIKQAIRHLTAMIIPQKETSILSDATEFWEGDNTQAQDFSHWRGVGRWTDERWLGIGQSNYQILQEMMDKHSLWNNSDYEQLKVLELGSGGGANIVELCRHFGSVYGADISSPNLGECGRQVSLLGLDSKFTPILFPIDKPEDILKKVAEKVDIVLAISVYTHFPNKEYGIRMTEILNRLLSSPGFAIIHIRHRDSVLDMIRNLNLRYMSMRRNYRRFVGFFTAFDVGEFTRVCQRSGFEVLEKKMSMGNTVHFLLKKNVGRVNY